MLTPQFVLPLAGEVIVDLFAGGGGWSSAFEMATGQHPHVAINHDADAISMHEMNHPQSKHYQADIYEVCPHEATGGMPIGWMHLSPDCTHHSQAKGGQPRDRKLRALSWVGVRWVGQKRPRIISLENVKQILNWGPLVAKRDKATGRVITLEMVTCPDAGKQINRIASPGERVPVWNQFLVPDSKRIGQTWKRFVAILRGMGYEVEWKRLVAADYGAPTTRDRLFMLARCDGQPIVWPEPTHFKAPTKKQKKWRSAAECIDWSIPGKSIFDRPKPLADATMRRIARGIKRYVLDSADPFIVPVTHQGSVRVHDIRDPLKTVTAAHRGELALATPVLIQAGHGEGKPGGVQRWGSGAKDVRGPLNTVTANGSGGQAIAAASLVKFRHDSDGADVTNPLPTITSGAGAARPAGNAHAMGVTTAFLAHLRGNCDARDADDPLMTVSSGGQHHGLVECELSPDDEAGALKVAAFLIRYYGEGGQWGDLRDPAHTLTTKDRLALVTVCIKGTPYVIVDIKLRMLEPHELYAAQGFPRSYIITHGHDGRKFSKSAQVKMCGNSVSPPPATALVGVNWNTQEAMRLVA